MVSKMKVYDPYGHSSLDLTQASLAYNGQARLSMVGMYFLGNGYRCYSPALKRFISPDSWSPFGNGGINIYAYCGCDPVNRQDPSGRMFGGRRSWTMPGGFGAGDRNRNLINYRRGSLDSSRSSSTQSLASSFGGGSAEVSRPSSEVGSNPVNFSGSPISRSSSFSTRSVGSVEEGGQVIERVSINISNMFDSEGFDLRRSSSLEEIRRPQTNTEMALSHMNAHTFMSEDDEIFYRTHHIQTSKGFPYGLNLSAQSIERLNLQRLDELKRRQ
jgi:RHS repeat-associated protein